MITRRHRRAAGRWLLPLLVVLLMLGHVCDLSALAVLDAHHHAHGDGDAQLGSCEAMPAASSTGQARACPAPIVAVAPPVVDEAPARTDASVVEARPGVIDRPPLFLLHAALLI